MQLITNLIMNFVKKDLPTALEKTLKKEIASVGHAVTCAIAPSLEKSVSSAVAELFQQLACDISNETGRKLAWMTEVASAINPTDPMIAMHVRPIFEQVHQIVSHQRSQPSISSSEASSIRILILVIKSVIRSFK